MVRKAQVSDLGELQSYKQENDCLGTYHGENDELSSEHGECTIVPTWGRGGGWEKEQNGRQAKTEQLPWTSGINPKKGRQL